MEKIRTATATDVKNRFGQFLELAQREPVAIEKTGRRVAVIISEEEYNRLSALDDAYWIERAKQAAATGFLSPEATMEFVQKRLAGETP